MKIKKYMTVAITKQQYDVLLKMATKEQRKMRRTVTVGELVRRLLEKELTE